MITLNGNPVEIGSFPDGTILMKQSNATFTDVAEITWKFENDREFLALSYLVKHLRRIGFEWIDLYMPYIPNARMDRVKNADDVFTLKYFSEILNGLEINSVTVLDPHSNVSEALISNCYAKTPEEYIQMALDDIDSDNLIVFYPDAGAMKRYADIVRLPYAYGLKNRDWSSGKILGLDVIENGMPVKNHDILIVDDICSRGGTFYYSAKKLKELGANRVFLYVTHCENTILDGEVLSSGLVDRVYTTDSLFSKAHDKIEVFKI